MLQTNTEMENSILEVAARIRELRGISGLSIEEAAKELDLTVEELALLESGQKDFPYTFIHKCARLYGVEMTEILQGDTARLRSYTLTRNGGGEVTAREDGILIKDLAPKFRDKMAETYWCQYTYSEEQQNQPIHLTTHKGQEFDYILSGRLKVQVGEHTEVLEAGDTIYYNSSTPHGMIAVGGKDCIFCAVVIAGEAIEEELQDFSIGTTDSKQPLLIDRFVTCEEDENGCLQKISFQNEDTFNFAYDVVGALAEKKPNKLAMIHLDRNKVERRYTFEEMDKNASRAANYFKSLGIKKGDRVMLVLKRHYQFWFAILGLHKLGAVVIPATHQLHAYDFEYRFNAAGVSAIVCTADDGTVDQAEKAAQKCPDVRIKVVVHGHRDGWHNFDDEYNMFSSKFPRTEDTACGDDPSVMFFTSGTTGYPKMAVHSYKYALGHFTTAKSWHNIKSDGLHLTISDTGWGKALWGKLYGQWMCEAAVFVYDFDRFDAHDILPLFAKYHITTFCAPPTMYRFMIKEDLSRYDLSSIEYATTAGEALNPEVYHQFKKATGLKIHEGFGQTETTLTIANFVGMKARVGSMGKPNPLYDVDLVDTEGNPVGVGETGEIVIHTDKNIPCGLFSGYYLDEEKTREVWHDGMYHTGDTAWRDEDGYFWYVGRIDDVIKSSGYRIGPFEIENVIMELPYVLECGVSAAPDEIRGQVVKASIVLTKGTDGTEELKKEIQQYVKERTAPYKYPRIVVFREELPKTISGKIQRRLL